MIGTDILNEIRSRHARKAGLRQESRLGVIGLVCKSSRVEKSAGGPMEIVSMATTDDLDLEGERVMPDGADWSYFQANGNVFLDHCYSSTMAVARLRSLKRVGNGWLCRAALNNDPDNESVRAVQVLAEAGGLAMSIGYEVKEAGPATPEEAAKYGGDAWIVRSWRGIEVSYTAMPCNVSARTLAVVYGDDGKAARSREVLTKNRVPQSAWGAVGLSKARRVVVCVARA